MRRPPATLRGVLVALLTTLTVAVGILTLVVGFSETPTVKAVQVLTVLGLGAIIIGGTIVFALVHLADWHETEDEFEQIVRRAERLAARQGEWEPGDEDYDWDEDYDPARFSEEEDFKALVRAAMDELPLELHRALEHVAIVVGESGSRVRVGRGRRSVYAVYEGDTVTQDYFHDRIVIFRDMLIRDFGHDPDLLREQVLRTVSAELTRHLQSGPGQLSDFN
jgi:predicted Zn-dependent protease with MMP-like domain